MSPRFLAALLSSPRMRSLAIGTTLPSVAAKLVTLPGLDPETVVAASGHLEFLDDLPWRVQYLLDKIAEVREMLVEGLETGACARKREDR